MEGKENLKVDVHNHHAHFDLGCMLKRLIDVVEGLESHHSVIESVDELKDIERQRQRERRQRDTSTQK
jgi:hypothetical protein